MTTVQQATPKDIRVYPNHDSGHQYHALEVALDRINCVTDMAILLRPLTMTGVRYVFAWHGGSERMILLTNQARTVYLTHTNERTGERHHFTLVGGMHEPDGKISTPCNFISKTYARMIWEELTRDNKYAPVFGYTAPSGSYIPNLKDWLTISL
jgi:hypothetical protein